MSKASDLARLVTSGSTTIHGEAGVTSSGSTGATTNLQQGLCKAWIMQEDGTTVHDSLNQASLTDEGTGQYKIAFTNNMNNNDFPVLAQMNPYTFTSGSKTVLNGSRAHHTDGQATNYYVLKSGQVAIGSHGSAIDVESAGGVVGDLA
tara:strand:- start:13797 stop:14240 length:444 start_codon:yes stop_codon:yes gene_type:complete